nr:MAG TPA: portal protein [Caudoviricetes sp.]
MKAITQYLKGLGYDCVEDDFYSQIDLWQKWYRGYVPSIHDYRQYNGRKKIRRTRKSLGMAKTVAEDWANLALNEKVGIALKRKSAEKRVWSVLDANQFRVRGNQLLEQAFALGTGAFVERKEGDEVKIDYIRAGMVYPLAWDNGRITQCAFGSERTVKQEKQVYLNIHTLANGHYVIENHLFRRNGTALTEIALPDDVKERVETKSPTPLFQIIRPNIANNFAPDCPLGISVYANALDQLEGLDLVYDSYCNEFRLGKKRITVPVTMARMAMEEDGSVTPVFDDNDTEFYAIPSVDQGENKIEEHNMELRYEAHEAGVQTALNLLSFKCGMGRDRYNFKDGEVKTATEVVSEKSDLFQSLKKHELLLEGALIGMTQAVAELLGLGEQEVTVNFDDSIIEDTGAEKLRFLQEIRDGVRQKWEYRVRFFGEDEATAKSMVVQDEPEEDLFGGRG